MHVLVKSARVPICFSSLKSGKMDEEVALLWLSPALSFLFGKHSAVAGGLLQAFTNSRLPGLLTRAAAEVNATGRQGPTAASSTPGLPGFHSLAHGRVDRAEALKRVSDGTDFY